MKITAKIEIDIDLTEVYKLCRPLVSRAECKKAIQSEAETLLRLRATDESGYWEYPYASTLANGLIRDGLAEAV